MRLRYQGPHWVGSAAALGPAGQRQPRRLLDEPANAEFASARNLECYKTYWDPQGLVLLKIQTAAKVGFPTIWERMAVAEFPVENDR